MKLRNKLILITSIISIIPMAFVIMNFMDLMKIKDPDFTDEVFRGEVLSRNIASWIILVPFLFELFVIITSTLLFFFQYDKNNKMDRWFNYGLFLLGGLGIHVILYFIFKNKEVSKRSKRPWLRIGGYSIAISSMVIPIITIAAIPKYSDPYLVDNTVYSTNRNAPNVIEIFSDGFDKEYTTEQLRTHKTIREFNFFKKYVTVGGITDLTMPATYGGFQKYNPISIWDRVGSQSYIDRVYEKEWYGAGMNHLQINKNKYKSRTLINPITFSNSGIYGATAEGTPRAIRKDDPELGVINWSGARDNIVGKWGVGNLSPDAYSYKYAGKHGEIDSSATKGSRVIISDLINHHPYLTGKGGKIDMTTISTPEKQAPILFDILEEYLNSLKQRKDENGRSVYDNSMIIIFGDHSTHGNEFPERGIADEVRHGESSLLIKYPDQHVGRDINDREVYSSQLNGIIDDFITNKPSNPMQYFNEARFNIRKLPMFYGWNRYMMTMVDYSTDKIVPDPTFTPIDVRTIKNKNKYINDRLNGIGGIKWEVN